SELKSQRERERVAFLGTRLSEFYWPLYIGLQKDNVVWQRILDRGSSDEALRKVGWQIETEFILPNHARLVQLIESKLHFARGDSELIQSLLTYIRHVAVYQALRTSGIHDRDPLQMNEPWPRHLFGQVEERALGLQKEYDSALASFSVQ